MTCPLTMGRNQITEILEYLKEEWVTISQAPLAFITLFFLSIDVAATVMSLRYEGNIEMQDTKYKSIIETKDAKYETSERNLDLKQAELDFYKGILREQRLPMDNIR